MKKLYKFASAAMFGLLIVSVLSSSVMAAVSMPTDLEGYELVGSGESTASNPFGSGDITTGYQLWVNVGDTLTTVVGAVVISADNNPLLEKIPALAIVYLESAFPAINFDGVETYWDLFVVLAEYSAPEIFQDITAQIETTDSSLAITIGDTFYGVISIDANNIFWTFALEIDNSWLSATQEQIIMALEGFMGQFASAIGAFSGYLGGSSLCSSAPIPEASEIPTTSSGDVNEFTSSYGTFYTSGIPGYSALIIIGLLGAFVLYFAKKKVVLH